MMRPGQHPTSAGSDAVSDPAMRYCARCGAARHEDSRFCGECGAEFDQLEDQLDNFNAQLSAELLAFAAIAEPPPPPEFESEPEVEPASAAPDIFESDVSDGDVLDGDAGVSEPDDRPAARQFRAQPEYRQPAAPDRSAEIAPDAAGWPDEYDTPARRRSPLAAIVLAAALLAGTGGYAYWSGLIGDRPGAVGQALQAELAAQGFPDVRIGSAGAFAYTLEGAVRTEQERSAALALARSFAGVDTVTDALTLQAPLAERLAAANRYIAQDLGEAGAVLAQGDGDALVLRGSVSAPGAAQAIQTALRDRFGLDAVADQTVQGAVPAVEATVAAPIAADAGQTAQSDAEPPAQPQQMTPPRQRAASAATSPAVRPAPQPTREADGPAINCLLPSGSEVRLSLSTCRARDGLVL